MKQYILPDTSEQVLQYTSALESEYYIVQLAIDEKATDFKPLCRPKTRLTYTTDQLIAATSYLKHMNAQGYNIYCRPMGWRYILLDDLTRQALTELASWHPALLVETSPNNYQAWLILPEEPSTREEAANICRALCSRFNGDPASAEPDHLGRLPGFTNRKAKHRQPDGRWPWAILRKAQHRTALMGFDEDTVLPVVTPAQTHRRITYTTREQDQSRADFREVCRLLRAGKSDSEITDWLQYNSPEIETRKGKHIADYIARTIKNARKLTRIF